jgi:cyclopropane-fatty-acyl-phospholipid synthase
MSSYACGVGPNSRDIPAYALEYEKGQSSSLSGESPRCTFIVRDEDHWRRLMASDAYQVAQAFVRSDFNVAGDLVEAIKVYRTRFAPDSKTAPSTVASYLCHQLRRRFHTGSSSLDIQFHYDRSNKFYKNFLDPRMVYSCAYFSNPNDTLEQAQLAKLDHICRKLQLKKGERFLDIGCGWGALLLRSADHYGTFSTGCTLSTDQRTWAMEECERRGLAERVTILPHDYRQLSGKFDKIASVGMFEHVGLRSLQNYFGRVSSLLTDGGYFLNHGIVRPSVVKTGSETVFLTREVFPGGELVRLVDVIRSAEAAGFEVLDVENLRPHYALTCRAWVNSLQKNHSQCLECVDTETYRTWLLYLAACAASFEVGETEIHQILLSKRGASRPWTRDYIYAAN